jgi:GT2 family glycosyltransferase
VSVAVVVVSWNTRDLLAACLRSLPTGLLEVVVVDNASSDGSAELVRNDFPAARLLALDENIGYGPAVNRGAAETIAPFVAAANSDLVFAQGAIDELLAAAARHPGAGAFAPRLVLADGSTQHSVHPFPTLPKLAAFNLGLTSLGLGDRLTIEGHTDLDGERTVDWAHGAFLMVRREAWDAVGGFDEAQWMYAEDLDLGWRLARAGRPTVYVPGAHVRHEVAAATTQKFGDDRAFRAQARAYAWMLRRRGLGRTRAAAVLNIAGAGARAALSRGPARAAARRWVTIHRSGLLPADELRRLR